jgi:hypothetical protein
VQEPHVTCVCPTTGDRRAFLPYAIRWFQAQDWHEADLLIVGDGPDVVLDLLPDDPRVAYIHLAKTRMPLGAKFNECVRRVRGPYVALWADDDWHAPWRLRAAMERLVPSKRLIAGTREMLFHRIGTGRTWTYKKPGPTDVPYFLGGSLVFHRRYWTLWRCFDSSATRSADASFTNHMTPEQYAELALVLEHPSVLSGYVATIHSSNTGRDDADPSGEGWSTWTGDLQKLMGPAHALWQPGGDICDRIR